MKTRNPLMFCALVLLVCLGLTSITQAVTVTGQEEWGINLYSDESLTCIAHYVWDSVVFNDVPEQTDTYTGGGIWGDIGWQAVLLDADRMIVDTGGMIACIYGPTITGGLVPELFSYNLFFQWDDAVADPLYPVYIDTAIYDGPYGSEPTNYWGWRGIPGDPGSWEYRAEPYYKDEPGYEEGFYNNPIPEPSTLLLLGLGGLALLRNRRFR